MLPEPSILGRHAHRDAAPVVAAEILLRHGLADDRVIAYLARNWPLDDSGCRSALAAARALMRVRVTS